MKLRDLEQLLEEVTDFETPKIDLEQYKTRPHLAACLLHSAQMQYNDIENRTILDLGCGTGCLSLGAIFLEAEKVYAVDIDEDALDIFYQNIEEFGVFDECDDDDDGDNDNDEKPISLFQGQINDQGTVIFNKIYMPEEKIKNNSNHSTNELAILKNPESINVNTVLRT